jgi:hypothetical protein
MNQIVNIFRKDARQLWMEIVASLVLLSFYTWFDPKTWVPGYSSNGNPAALGALVVGLLCASWAVMMIRLVQSERLVGVNQFWTTRPYEWPKLLAAKVLFVLAFLYVPLAISQVFLLYEANLPVGGNLGPLLGNLLLLTAFLFLPIAALCAVTGSFGKAALAMLGALVSIVAEFFFMSAVIPGAVRGVWPRGLGSVLPLTLAVVCSAVLLNQYRRRATLRSLLLIAIVPVAIFGLQMSLGGSALVVRGYAAASGNPPVSIRFDPENVGTEKITSGQQNKDVFVTVPIVVEGIVPGTGFEPDAERITLTGDDGYSWHSGWDTGENTFGPVSGGAEHSYATFMIPRKVYDRLSHEATSVEVEFALAQLEDAAPVEDKISMEGDRVAGLDSCSLSEPGERPSQIYCRSAFRNGGYFGVRTFRRVGECTNPEGSLEPTHAVVGSVRSPSMLPAISPVSSLEMQLSRNSGGPKGQRLCEGTPITFIEKRVVGRVMVEMPAQRVELGKLAGLNEE